MAENTARRCGLRKAMAFDWAINAKYHHPRWPHKGFKYSQPVPFLFCAMLRLGYCVREQPAYMSGGDIM